MDQQQFEATLADAEVRLRRLRTLYDQWFHGLERSEPQVQRAEIDKKIADMRRAQPRNTALRFRFNQLVQRYTTYNTYWQRITRQIEEGTYKRDVLRAKRRFGEDGERDRKNAADGYELDIDIDIEAALDGVRSEPPAGEGSGLGPLRSSRPPPNSDRPQRAPREITPFALPINPAVPALEPNAVPAAAAAPAPAGAAPRPAGVAAPVAPPLNRPVIPAAAAAAVAALRKPAVPPPSPLGASLPPMVSRRPPPPPPAGGAGAGAGAVKRPPPAAPPPAGRPAATKPGSNGLSDAQIQGIYQRYVAARRDNNERVDNVKLETIAKTVRDMMPKLNQKHAGKQIDFEVVVKDGRVALKPTAK
jgi:hypothetical protein